VEFDVIEGSDALRSMDCASQVAQNFKKRVGDFLRSSLRDGPTDGVGGCAQDERDRRAERLIET
jgi:hypothetical protein